MGTGNTRSFSKIGATSADPNALNMKITYATDDLEKRLTFLRINSLSSSLFSSNSVISSKLLLILVKLNITMYMRNVDILAYRLVGASKINSALFSNIAVPMHLAVVQPAVKNVWNEKAIIVYRTVECFLGHTPKIWNAVIAKFMKPFEPNFKGIVIVAS